MSDKGKQVAAGATTSAAGPVTPERAALPPPPAEVPGLESEAGSESEGEELTIGEMENSVTEEIELLEIDFGHHFETGRVVSSRAAELVAEADALVVKSQKLRSVAHKLSVTAAKHGKRASELRKQLAEAKAALKQAQGSD